MAFTFRVVGIWLIIGITTISLVAHLDGGLGENTVFLFIALMVTDLVIAANTIPYFIKHYRDADVMIVDHSDGWTWARYLYFLQGQIVLNFVLLCKVAFEVLLFLKTVVKLQMSLWLAFLPLFLGLIAGISELSFIVYRVDERMNRHAPESRAAARRRGCRRGPDEHVDFSSTFVDTTTE